VRLAAIILVVLGAGVVKGGIGFGFPLVAAPLLSNIWDPRHAVLLLALASLSNNVGIVFGLLKQGEGSRRTSLRLAPTLAGLIVGTVGGALLLASLDPNLLGAIVGLAALAFAVVSLLKPSLAVPAHLERYLALPIGLIGGLLGGSTSIAGPAIVSYTHALQLEKREFVLYISLMYLISAVVQVVSYLQLGLFDLPVLMVGAVTFVPNLLGVSLGLRLQDRIDAALFRRLVVILIALSGLSLLARAVWR
jgi:uncharacterized membrane protein YfcA